MFKIIFQRVSEVLVKPSQTWTHIKEEETGFFYLYKTYILFLAGVPAIAQLIGMSLIGINVPFIGNILIPFKNSFGYAVFYYLFSLAGVMIVAFIINMIAPNFGSEKNFNNALKVVVYSWFPAWIGGIFFIIPGLSFLALLISLYGIYLMYIGLPLLMNTPKEKSAGFLVTTIIISILFFFLDSYIAEKMFPISTGLENDILKNLDIRGLMKARVQ